MGEYDFMPLRRNINAHICSTSDFDKSEKGPDELAEGAMKESCTGAKTFKARYVGKGYSQVKMLTT